MTQPDSAASLAARVAACERCSAPCRVGQPPGQDARLLRRAATPKGLCASCAMTAFLKCTEPLASILAARGPGLLLLPGAQTQAASVMAAGNADADPSEIDWQHVVRYWALPVAGESHEA